MATFISNPRRLATVHGMHVNHHISIHPEFPFILYHMATMTLLEFATDQMLTNLLVKERAKYLARNRSDKHKRLDKDCDLFELTPRKMLSRMMPPRRFWVKPRKRKPLANKSNGKRKIAEKALLLTIKRDRYRQASGATFPYLDELDRFMDRIRQRLSSDSLQFASPRLIPIYKDKEKLSDGTLKVTCRPLSVNYRLEDKIILALTSRYLTKNIDRYLHTNILSYRSARNFGDKKHHVTDFNDGIRLVKEYRDAHANSPIYVADCDIKKFYDIIPHQVVRECFSRILDQSRICDEGKAQVMRVLESYLASYNFYTNAWLESQNNNEVFNKLRHCFGDKERKNTYQLKWVDEIMNMPDDQKLHLGVPQGGALSLLVANIVLNDVDKVLTDHEDPNQLFIRFCDDIILMHTDYDECCRLIDLYAQSLKDHGLYYHDFEPVGDRKHFWSIKSHLPFLWDDGDDNANRYVGFLGYEMRRDGRLRLRKSNINKFVDKFQRKKYALRRYRKKHPEEDFEAYQNKVLSRILDGINFYEALDLQLFKDGSQYGYLKKLKERTMQ